MNNKKTTIITYSSLAIAIVVAIFFMFKSNGLQKELKQSNNNKAAIDKAIKSYQQLLQIDSILVKGQYELALKAYNDEMKDKDMDDIAGVQLRIDIAEQLLRMKVERGSNQVGEVKLDSLDSIQSSRLFKNREIKRYDSLNFAFEKTKVQLEGMRSQLKNKSFGEYLSFKSSKANQMHYVGQVKSNQANGRGVAILNTGSRYEGEWKANKRHGEGTFYWPDGEYYVGSYLNDQRNGLGTYYWPNGEKYVGQWKNDKRNGKGVFYGKDGKEITSGIWKNDKLAEEDKE
ncbi:MAG: hypothetical protein WBB27_04300 [Maribacter sp.]